MPVRCQWTNVPAEKRITWRLTINDRRIAQGTKQLSDDDERLGYVDLPVEIPILRDEISLDVTLEAATGDEPQVCKALRILAADPFAGRKQLQQAVAISLFDPESSTQKTLEQAGYSVKRLRSVAAIDAIHGGIVIVGQGVAWNANRGLAEAIHRLASQGTSVLCLAPADGSLNILSTDGRQPGRLLLAGNEIIKEYDARLDAEAWLGGKSVATRFAWQAAQGRVTLVASSTGAGWPFVSLNPPSDAGHQATSWVLCGYDIIGRWNDGPVPRYLLAAMVTALANGPGSQSTTHEKVSDL